MVRKESPTKVSALYERSPIHQKNLSNNDSKTSRTKKETSKKPIKEFVSEKNLKKKPVYRLGL
jgi:hypothetical protein